LTNLVTNVVAVAASLRERVAFGVKNCGHRRCRRGSSFVGRGLAHRAEPDDQAIRIRRFDIPAEVTFGGCSVLDTERVEAPAPVVEIVSGSDTERNRTEAAESACERWSVVQAEGEAALVHRFLRLDRPSR
jgi:hypothetical protein